MDFEAFKRTLPLFKNAYRPWYSQALALSDYCFLAGLTILPHLYDPPKNRKDITKIYYCYLMDVKVLRFEDKVLVGPVHAIPAMEQQLQILNSVKVMFETSLIDITRLIQAELLDAELNEAEILLKNKCLRSAGVICSVVLKKHLNQVCGTHQLKVAKKNPSVGFYNDLLKKHEAYDFSKWGYIQILDAIQELSFQAQKRKPTDEEIKDLIIGTDKVIKMIF